jgi:hypothetical protein
MTRSAFGAAALVALMGMIGLAPGAQAVATCQAGGPCAIGDVGPGGGIVFIAPRTAGNTTGQFFEAAPNTWAGSAPDGTTQWCNASFAGISGLGTAIGTGTTNSATIASTCTSTGANNSASYIRGLTIGGLTGWFLPSQDEMLALYDARAFLTGIYATNQLDPDAARYLTSSQAVAFSGANAMGVYMQGSSFPGTAQGINKQFAFSTRAVRMFTAADATASAAPIPMWQQAIGRASATAACPEGYTPSWAMWPNNGTGGFVCNKFVPAYGN